MRLRKGHRTSYNDANQSASKDPTSDVSTLILKMVPSTNEKNMLAIETILLQSHEVERG